MCPFRDLARAEMAKYKKRVAEYYKSHIDDKAFPLLDF